MTQNGQKAAAKKASPRPRKAADRKPPLEQRVTGLETQVAELTDKVNKLLAIVAAQLAQQMQPQVQQAILAKLTGAEAAT